MFFNHGCSSLVAQENTKDMDILPIFAPFRGFLVSSFPYPSVSMVLVIITLTMRLVNNTGRDNRL
jgi:hypothetical protein